MSELRLRNLKGLGIRSEEMLSQVGIYCVDDFIASDPFEIYKSLKEKVPGTSLNMLYAMIGAQENRNWREVKDELKTAILLRLEQMGIAPR